MDTLGDRESENRGRPTKDRGCHRGAATLRQAGAGGSTAGHDIACLRDDKARARRWIHFVYVNAKTARTPELVASS